jgi:hypothetical protein
VAWLAADTGKPWTVPKLIAVSNKSANNWMIPRYELWQIRAKLITN